MSTDLTDLIIMKQPLHSRVVDTIIARAGFGFLTSQR